MEKGSNIPNIYYSQKELKHFDFEILVIYGILEHTVLNIFKYIFWHICFKISKEKKKEQFTNISELYQGSERFQHS